MAFGDNNWDDTVVKIEPLSRHACAIGLLSEWYTQEWEQYYGEFGHGDARADLASRCNDERIPSGLVALEDDEIQGTVALDLDPATNLTPSVVGLLVRRDRRRRGIATALLNAAESLSQEFGYDRLYISTSVLGNLLLRRGWSNYGEVEFLNRAHGSIYVRKFQD